MWLDGWRWGKERYGGFACLIREGKLASYVMVLHLILIFGGAICRGGAHCLCKNIWALWHMLDGRQASRLGQPMIWINREENHAWMHGCLVWKSRVKSILPYIYTTHTYLAIIGKARIKTLMLIHIYHYGESDCGTVHVSENYSFLNFLFASLIKWLALLCLNITRGIHDQTINL